MIPVHTVCTGSTGSRPEDDVMDRCRQGFPAAEELPADDPDKENRQPCYSRPK